MTKKNIQETDTSIWNRDFILNVDDATNRLRLAVRANQIDGSIRKMFIESNATVLEVRSSLKYNIYKTDSKAFIKILELFFRNQGRSTLTGIQIEPYVIIVHRIAEFNYILNKQP